MMEPPTLRSSIADPKSGVTYHIMAYRPLTRTELVQAVRVYHAQHSGKKLKRGQEVVILSSIGHDE